MSHPSPPSWPSLYNPGLEIIHIEHRSAVQNGAAYLYHPSDIFRFTFYWTLIFYAPLFLICGFFAFWNLTFPPSLRPYNLHLPLHPSSLRPEDPAEPRYNLIRQSHSSSGSSYPLTPFYHNKHIPRISFSPTLLAAPTFSSSHPHLLPDTLHSFSFPSSSHPSGPPLYPTSNHFHHPRTLHESALNRSQPNLRYKFKENERRSRFTFAFLVLLTFLAAGLAGAAISSAIVGFVAAGFFKAANYNMSTWIPFLLAVMHVLVGYLSLWPSIIDII